MSDIKLPIMRLFTPRNLAYVLLFGRRHYLGPWGTKAADDAYRVKLRALLGIIHSGPVPAAAPRRAIIDVETVMHLAEAFGAFAPGHYTKRGRPTHTAYMAKRLRDLIAQAPPELSAAAIDAIDSQWLRDLRTHIATDLKGITRGTLNAYIEVVVRMFRFGGSNGLCDDTLWQKLKCLEPVRKGRPPAPGLPKMPEGRTVHPVPREWIRLVRPHLGRTVRIMLTVQLLTGMRPNELCWLRPKDLSPARARGMSRVTGVQIYTVAPEVSKTDHEEASDPRRVWVGPRALRLLALIRPARDDDFYFSPRRAREEFDAGRSAKRILPRWPSHDPEHRRSIRRSAGIVPTIEGDRYTPDAYRRAMTRACERAIAEQTRRGVKPAERSGLFTPYRLRHNCATEIANREQLQIAQVMLGHKNIQTTAGYVKPWEKHAVAAALKYG